MMTSLDNFSKNFISGVNVFIFHQRNDKDIALKVQKKLEIERIKSFLDATDNGHTGFKTVTEWIVTNLRKSTHILVVYTNNTKSSEWVPFEIGMAYEREEGIAIFDPQHIIGKPNYLNDLPIIPDMDSLKYFVFLCKNYSKAKQSTLKGLEKSANEISHSHLGTFAKNPAQIRFKNITNDSMQKQLRMPLSENIQNYLTVDFVPNYAKFFIDSLNKDLGHF